MKTSPDSLKVILKELRELRQANIVAGAELLPLPAAAAFLGLSARTVRNELSRGIFPIKPRRHRGKILFHRSDLEEYADSLPAYTPRERKLIGTTFLNSVPKSEHTPVPEIGTNVPITEGLLRNILDRKVGGAE